MTFKGSFRPSLLAGLPHDIIRVHLPDCFGSIAFVIKADRQVNVAEITV